VNGPVTRTLLAADNTSSSRSSRALRAARRVLPLIEYALRAGYSLRAEKITCPVRIVWGTDDQLLPWPSTASRYRNDWLPHADWVELEGIGHCPQLDVPLETAQLIVGFTARDLPQAGRVT